MRQGGCVEEVAEEKFDGDLFSRTVIPLMANNRIAVCGKVDNENEIHRFQYYVTTAGSRQSFAFNKMKEIIGDMYNGKSAFCIGNGYELPCMHEQLDINYVNEQKESPTFNPLAFQREYESIWTGSSDNSLVDLDDLNKCRILKIPEFKYKDKDASYILSYDVARAEGSLNAQSALAVIKIIPKRDGTYHKHLVNIFSFEGTHFLEQAYFIKKKVNEYKAEIVVLDTNGLGVGLCDYLVTEIDENPAYEVVNDERYDKYKTDNSIPILYSMKSHTKENKNKNIHNVFVNHITHQKIKMLKSESYYRSEIINNKKSGKELSDKYIEKSKPFVITDILCDEIMNLEYKQSGNNTNVKQISKSINKDKFSALEYGLYWIYLKERDNKVRKEETIDLSVLTSSFRKPNLRKRNLS